MTVRQSTDRRRRGAAMLWALIVLAVLGVTSATAAWQFSAARRGLALRHNRLQAEWLVRSGAELAAARLLGDPNGYSGETVELIPDGTVRIVVEKDPAKGDTYRIRCEANYPKGERTEVSRAVDRTLLRRTEGGTTRVEMSPTQDSSPP